ncbi:MAG: hypothetical protein B7Z40_18665 [Bosea sp. 12-68-7]|nr:MAG: hypothetical protein B7Z40_18665 [Bosea sp. 12-68-7]
MTDLYQPASDFLVMVINGEVPLTGSVFAEANLSRLIDYTRDSDISNRDWATFHLGHTDIDTPEVRTALHDRLNDEDPTVQEEAMLGLARRRDETALPLMRDWLQARPVSQIILEAAEAFADILGFSGKRHAAAVVVSSPFKLATCNAVAFHPGRSANEKNLCPRNENTITNPVVTNCIGR